MFSNKLGSRFPSSEVFLVGGAVRDVVMGREVGDVDIVVRNVPLAKLVAFLKTQGDANLVGKNFGVIKFTPYRTSKASSGARFRPKGESITFDIALPRTDHSFHTGGYRDVQAAYDHRLPIEKDLERRDFACNAIALRVKSRITNHESRTHNSLSLPLILRGRIPSLNVREGWGELGLIDPFGGLKDIQKKIIRAVGDSERRLKEDYTRMLRALRFSCQLGFSIEKKTWGSIRKNVGKINQKLRKSRVPSPESRDFVIARELIAKEFLKGMYHDPVRMLTLMDRSGLSKELIPELLPLKICRQDPRWHSEGNVWVHTLLALKLASSLCHPKPRIGVRGRPDLGSKQKKQKDVIASERERAWRSLFSTKNGINNASASAMTKPVPFSFLDSVSGHGMTTEETLELYLGILFHDIGKPETFGHEKRNDPKAITYYGHETVGAEMTRKICTRLKLSAPEEYRVDSDHVVWLVKNHMLLHPENAVRMKNSTLEKYFFNPRVPGNILLGVSLFDGLATVPKGFSFPLKVRNAPYPPLKIRGGKGGGMGLQGIAGVFKSWPTLKGWYMIQQRIRSLGGRRKELPKSLLNGHEIMALLGIGPGVHLKPVIEALREAQLEEKVRTKEEAKIFVRKHR